MWQAWRRYVYKKFWLEKTKKSGHFEDVREDEV
jgi:hypothetical protein